MRIRDFRLDAFTQRSSLLNRLRSSVFLAVMVITPFTAGVSQLPQPNGGMDKPARDSSGVPPPNPMANPVPDSNRFMEDSMRIKDNQKRIAALNLMRQKDMVSDTAKLVVLAIQLKAETDQSSKEKLSVVELRKAELIEKLAKSVRTKMKGWGDD
jgi:hypothetical protein